MFRQVVSLIVLVQALVVMAQGGPLRFQHLKLTDGLSDNGITCLFEDRAGTLWIGTEKGLDRYDGNIVLPVDGITDHITGVAEDDEGTLWVTTKDRGLMRLLPGNGTLRRFTHDRADPRSIASDLLTCVIDLNDTTVLVGSREVNLIFVDKRTLGFSYWQDSLSLSPTRATRTPVLSGWCHAVLELDDDRLWVGFLNNHLSMIADRRTGRVQRAIHVRRPGFETSATALLSGERLFIGGWQHGLDILRPGASAEHAVLFAQGERIHPVPDEVRCMTHWSEGHIVVGTHRSGLYLIDPENDRIVQNRHHRNEPTTLSNDQVRCMLKDRNGILWVGTANGLNKHLPSVWEMYTRALFDPEERDPPELVFHNAEALSTGGARAYTSNGFYEVADTPIHRPLRFNGISLQPTTMNSDHEGNQLVGTEHGVMRLRAGRFGSSFEPMVDTNGGPIDYRVGNMFQVRGIWADTVNNAPVIVLGALGFGLQVIDAHTHALLGWAMPSDALKAKASSLINTMVRDGSGRYWCGTASGVFSWHPSEPLLEDLTTNVNSSDDGRILLGDEDVRHLVLVDDRPWGVTRQGTLFTIREGVAEVHQPGPALSCSMFGLTADHTGDLWIATDNGLLQFRKTSATFTRIPINEGSLFRKLTRAITTLTNGHIALFADNTCITFDPKIVSALPTLPTAYITSARSTSELLAVHEGSIGLSYRSSVVDITVSANSMLFAEPVLFDYKLEGVEHDWRALPADGTIQYAGIPTGEHALIVRVRDRHGRINTPQRLLTIHVAGPIWQQWWFYALASLFISIALYALYRYRLSQALKLQAVRNRIASDLHDEVGSSLSSITIGSQLAAQLSRSENTTVKELLGRIGETSDRSLRSMSDIVWAIDPKNDEGEALVKRMRRIANELLESKGMEVDLILRGAVEELKLPMNMRKDLLLIFKEAAHNASKYSAAQRVVIHLERNGDRLSLKITDDGKGFDPSLHADGHGLGSMHRRAIALGTELAIESAPGHGTTVHLTVDLTRTRD